MKNQRDFAVGGMVSIWIGNFSSDDEFDEYMNLSGDFENDFGFKIDDNGIREGSVESCPKPIEQLVKGFSHYESFGLAAAEAAKEA